VDVVPLFLGMGGHVRRDVPVLVARLRERHPAVAWTLHGAAGEAEGVIAALAEAAVAAVCASAPAGATDPEGRSE
jgi:sirohydrochlorin cobaltochelatase